MFLFHFDEGYFVLCKMLKWSSVSKNLIILRRWVTTRTGYPYIWKWRRTCLRYLLILWDYKSYWTARIFREVHVVFPRFLTISTRSKIFVLGMIARSDSRCVSNICKVLRVQFSCGLYVLFSDPVWSSNQFLKIFSFEASQSCISSLKRCRLKYSSRICHVRKEDVLLIAGLENF